MRCKKLLAIGLSMVCAVSLMGCGGTSEGSDSSGSSASSSGSSAAASQPITVVSREDGSGTRGAFIELFGVEEEDADGNKVDNTTEDAAICTSTESVMTTVAGDEYAIGYSSMGALNDSVKALTIDGVEPTTDNVVNGSYTIQRPFNIAVKDDLSDVAQDFINYILSSDGQAVVEEKGYVSVGDTGSYTASGMTGKIVIAGSSSVTPVMEKLTEAYKELNPDVEIEVQESDSTTGMTSAAEGTCDIGMASRELKDSEIEAGLSSTQIAIDGIAVIVNTNNSLDDISPDLVKSIFTGEITDWSEVTE